MPQGFGGSKPAGQRFRHLFHAAPNVLLEEIRLEEIGFELQASGGDRAMADDTRDVTPNIGEETRRRREQESRRLAQALRDNLAKRKAQSRARTDTDPGEAER
jgi:hypothetical protein